MYFKDIHHHPKAKNKQTLKNILPKDISLVDRCSFYTVVMSFLERSFTCSENYNTVLNKIM